MWTTIYDWSEYCPSCDFPSAWATAMQTALFWLILLYPLLYIVKREVREGKRSDLYFRWLVCWPLANRVSAEVKIHAYVLYILIPAFFFINISWHTLQVLFLGYVNEDYTRLNKHLIANKPQCVKGIYVSKHVVPKMGAEENVVVIEFEDGSSLYDGGRHDTNDFCYRTYSLVTEMENIINHKFEGGEVEFKICWVTNVDEKLMTKEKPHSGKCITEIAYNGMMKKK